MKFFVIVFVLVMCLSCKNENGNTESVSNPIMTEPNGGIGNGAVSPAIAFASTIEDAHQKNVWNSKRAVSFRINLKFNEEERLVGRVTTLTNSSKIRLDLNDGTKLIYDGKEAYLCPPDKDFTNARFDLFTWQYFFAMPFKLNDPGTNWELMQGGELNNQPYNTAKLSFKENIGDAPDDWYVVYQDPRSNLLHAAAYIVTYNADKNTAEENPHAIVYSDYKEIEGMKIATKWDFYNWNEKDGLGSHIGNATLTDVTFFNAKDELFEEPDEFKKI